MENARLEADGVSRYLLAAYYLLTNTFSITIAVIGVLFIAIGRFVLPGIHDVMAGMFGVWGVSLVLFGVLMYIALWLNKLYARITAERKQEEKEEESGSESGAESDLSL